MGSSVALEEAAPDSEDPLQRLEAEFASRDAREPADTAVKRLFPDASRDPALAAEYGRLGQLDLAEGKIADLRSVMTVMGEINRAAICFADTNNTPDALDYLFEHCRVPVFCDPISTVKAARLIPHLGRLHTVKPNRQQAEILSGVEIRCEDDLEKAARVLLGRGSELDAPDGRLHLGGQPPRCRPAGQHAVDAHPVPRARDRRGAG